MGEGRQSDRLQAKEPAELRLVVALGAILMGLTVTLTFAQVVLRTVFNEPQAWVEEVSRYIFVWVVFLGVAVAAYRDSHIRLDVVDALVSGRGLWLLKKWRTLVEIMAGGLLLYSGLLVAWRNRSSSFYTIPALPQVVFYLAVPVCSLLVIWFLVRRLRGNSLT